MVTLLQDGNIWNLKEAKSNLNFFEGLFADAMNSDHLSNSEKKDIFCEIQKWQEIVKSLSLREF